MKQTFGGLFCASLVLIVLLTTSQAIAGPALSGTAIFTGPNDGSDPPGYRLNGTVDYAVWAPGTFPYSATANVPIPITDYVYTYQIHDNPATGPLGYSAIPNGTDPENPVDISQLVIGIFASATIDSIGEFTALGGVAPNSSLDTVTPGDAAYWYFGFPNAYDPSSVTILPGQSSVGLLFTSPDPYGWAQSSVFDHGTSAQFFLPSPVPEASTMVIWSVLGVVGVAVRWWRRSRVG